MDTGLSGKGVLVTGASGGIGAACARAFAAERARVALHYHRGEARARELAAALDGAPVLRSSEQIRSILAVRADGAGYATVGTGRIVHLWDVAKKEPVRKLEGAGATIVSLAFSPDGKRIVAGLEDGSLVAWDAAGGAAQPLSNKQETPAAPLTFLGGAFYSIKMLPPFWQAVTLFNPVVYLVSGFRWAFYGVSDVAVGVSLAAIVGFLLACLAAIWWILRTGWKLKA